jgi:cell division protein ZapA (FtsZ GTPase activity inhibitor)
MSTREEVAVTVAGHEIKMQIAPDERIHVEKAARQVNERLQQLGSKAGSLTPHKVAAMVAFQFACDLSIAHEMLDEAEKLADDLRRQKEAVARLEKLLARVDDALTV